MKNIKLLLFVCLFTGMLPGCGKDGDVEKLAELGQDKVADADFKAYLKAKNIPDIQGPRLKQLRDQYEQRIKLVNAIVATGKLDKGLIEAKMRHYRNELIISAYFDEFQKSSVSDDEIHKYFEDHKADFSSKKAKAAQILVRVSPNLNEQQRKEKFKDIVSIYEKLKAGQSFAALAKKYSEDFASRSKGGDMGVVEEVRLDPVFAKTLFSLQKGNYSEPFNTPQGYHIVKLLSEPETLTKPYDSIKGQIAFRMRKEAKDKELDRLLSQ